MSISFNFFFVKNKMSSLFEFFYLNRVFYLKLNLAFQRNKIFQEIKIEFRQTKDSLDFLGQTKNIEIKC